MHKYKHISLLSIGIVALAAWLLFLPQVAGAEVNAGGIWVMTVPSPGGIWQLTQDGASVSGSTISGQYAYFSGTAQNSSITGIIWLAQGPPPNIPYQTGHLAAAVVGNKLSGLIFWYFPVRVLVPVTGIRIIQ
jgi:hypothetical protein